MNDFDFLHGTWDVANRRLFRLFAGCDVWETFVGHATVRPLLGGLGNIDEIVFPTQGFSGATLRLYDRELDRWSIHWTSSRTGRLDPPVVGGFYGDRGDFFGIDLYEGRTIRVHFVWHRLGRDQARWEQRFSNDEGATWELNWVMDLQRVLAPTAERAAPTTTADVPVAVA
ncbi:hypothetical protein [Yinghuangia seranimata]|uniref:hypothetical protein n=1 Tax=Yinghuangia seranimata TaxID=408067 RepID=UPI00248CA4A2|nr:hypothetical protein [Yinghuangia seranimata]MDI2130719.1 hypothetical protein [Yinghuangia seranimata]